VLLSSLLHLYAFSYTHSLSRSSLSHTRSLTHTILRRWMQGVVLSFLLIFILFLTHALSRVRALVFPRTHTHDNVQVDEKGAVVIFAYTHTPSLLHTLSLTLRLSLSLSLTPTHKWCCAGGWKEWYCHPYLFSWAALVKFPSSSSRYALKDTYTHTHTHTHTQLYMYI